MTESKEPVSETREETPHRQYVEQWYLDAINSVLSEKITPGHLADILTKRELELEKRTDHDGLLVDFYNTNGFLKELDRAIALAKRKPGLTGSLLALDIDGFKRFNDTFGHPEGDELLRTYAQVIKDQARDSDIRGRLGGDELAIYLIGCDNAQALEAAQRIRQATVASIKKKFPNLSWEQTISIGVSQLEENDTSASLRERADQALYKAKESRATEGRIKIHQSDTLPPSDERKPFA